MRVVHLCLSNYFIEGQMYQENELVRCHVKMGHDVLIIASTQIYAIDGRRVHVKPGIYNTVPGARLVRVPYLVPFADRVMRKVRAYRGVIKLLESFAPDSLVFHGTSAFELFRVARYARRRSEMPFYIDNHTDRYNSGRNFFSLQLMHRLYYGLILRCAAKQARAILCNTKDGMEFLREVYRLPVAAVEYFPLGGRIPDEQEFQQRRERGRGRYKVASGEILVVQAGKQTKEKKLIESIEAISASGMERIRFVIAGSLDTEIAPVVERSLKTRRAIQWAGWLGEEDLLDLLCAADVYLQPGTQSVTLQQSLCCRCAVIISSYLSHDMYVNQNGFIIGRDGTLAEILGRLISIDLKAMGERSYQIAREKFDYTKLALRLLR